MLRLIVVPLDGSSFGEQALPLAIRIAERQRAELELVHVFEALPAYETQGAPPPDPALDVELRKDRRSYLDGITDWLQRNTSAKVSATLLTGDDVAATLSDHLNERHADLVTMATHGRGGLSRIWLGSVANDVVRRADVPVLLIRPTESGSRDTKSMPFRLAVIPLDGSPADDDAIDDTISVAGDPGVELLLLHVVVPVVYLTDPPATALSIEMEIESAMQQYLEEVARRVRARGFSVNTRVLADASPAHAIVEVANERGADLIAMETHAWRGASRLLFGSVTDKVIRAARVPVLVHRRRVEAEQGRTEAQEAGGHARS
jgi:nucleotide-binding universal stress UspA family protein